jgi:hypothetical protein
MEGVTCHYCGHELEDKPVSGHGVWQWVCPACLALYHEDSGYMEIIHGPENGWEKPT